MVGVIYTKTSSVTFRIFLTGRATVMFSGSGSSMTLVTGLVEC